MLVTSLPLVLLCRPVGFLKVSLVHHPTGMLRKPLLLRLPRCGSGSLPENLLVRHSFERFSSSSHSILQGSSKTDVIQELEKRGLVAQVTR
jgi:hypothetical protein